MMVKRIPTAQQTETTVAFGPWPKGMNNRQPDYALPDGTLRNLVNGDITVSGHLGRRAGYTKVVGGLGLRGGFSCPIGTYFIRNNELCVFGADESVTVLDTGIVGPTPTYAYFDGVVYFSDGLVTRKLSATASSPWGVPTPAAPTVNIVAGSMPLGTYLVAITAIGADGVESGASDLVSIVNPADSGGLQVVGLPTASDANIYVSSPNGEMLYLAGTATAGATSYSVTAAVLGTGAPLTTHQIIPPPPGRIVREYNGRIYIAAGNVLWVTEPYATSWVHVIRGVIMQPADITVVEAGSSGLWVVSDKTYFFRGSGPEDFQISQALEYGAVFGTGARIPYANEVTWYSAKGLVVASGDGQVKNVQEDNVAPHTGTAGATLIREQDGSRQAVVSVQEAQLSPLAASTFFQMEVVRKAGGHKP